MAITDSYLPYNQQSNTGYSFSSSLPSGLGKNLTQAQMLAQQDNDFGLQGTEYTAEALLQNSPGAYDKFKSLGSTLAGGNYSYSPSLTFDQQAAAFDAGKSFDNTTGTNSWNQIATPPPDGESWWDSIKGLVGNKGFMSGALGLGNLGLGLASYLQQKPLYEEQLKGLKQNRQFAAENQQNRKNIASDLG